MGVILPDGGSLDGVVGIPPESQEQADYAAVFDSLNKTGGIQCHPVVGDYQDFHELNPGEAQSGCLKFVQDKVFAVLGGYLPLSSDACLLQNHIPTFEQIEVMAASVKQFYPFYFSLNSTYDLLFHNFSHAAAQMGYFGPAHGFKKLGIVYTDCISGEYQALLSAIESAGVPGSQITSADLGCESGFASPSAIEEAVLQFRQAGVTTVTTMDMSLNMQNFTRQAQSQGFKPVYVLPDDGIVPTTTVSAAFRPDPNNFNNAVAITPSAFGQIASGLPETARTKACDAIMTAHGLPTVYQSGDGYAGAPCNFGWLIQALGNDDPGLNQAGLAAAMTKVGSIALSYPDGPDTFGSGVTYGGEYWRPVQYYSSCACWKVLNPNYKPSFG